jgi:pyrroline-5-carboxylate reductase
MNTPTIAFLGCGNMGRCLIGGLLADGHPAANVVAADSDAAQLALAADRYSIRTTLDNQAAVKGADVIVLAVKPQQMQVVVDSIVDSFGHSRSLAISIAAGIRSADLTHWLGDGAAVVRAMPNTPALVRAGATAMFANDAVTSEQRQLAETVLGSAGLVLWVDDETQMDAVTAVSGSGPAYFFRFMEILSHTGEELGLSGDTAKALAIQTAYGAARMALNGELTPGELRTQVTSPGGTTERALKVLEEHGIADIFGEAVKAACLRSAELAQEFGEN